MVQAHSGAVTISAKGVAAPGTRWVMKRSTLGTSLFALILAGAGCSTDPDPQSQILTGRVTTSGAIAVRAVSDGSVVTAAQIRSDGTFTLSLPPGASRYRLEVLTTSGVRHVFKNADNTFADLSFRVCQPTDPFDIGPVGPDAMGGGMGGGDDPVCSDPMDPNCGPPTCDPTDPTCTSPWPGCDPMDPTDPNCPPPCPANSMDPNCPPPPHPCDPMDPANPMGCPPDPCIANPMDPACQPPPPCVPNTPGCMSPPCMNPMDPNCGLPPTPCNDPTDPYCYCDAMGECPPPTCTPSPGEPGPANGDDPVTMCPPPPPPPCASPMDPSSCPNPCENDPMSCGCASNDPTCWPVPQPPECDAMGGMCEPGSGGLTPENPPSDFGCGPAMEPAAP